MATHANNLNNAPKEFLEKQVTSRGRIMSVRENLSVQVQKRNRENRRPRGFSQGELRKPGLTTKQALHAGFPIDVRRRAVHHENGKLAQEQVRHFNPVKKHASKVMITSSANS
jgi:ribosomal protein L13E